MAEDDETQLCEAEDRIVVLEKLRDRLQARIYELESPWFALEGIGDGFIRLSNNSNDVDGSSCP